MIRAWAVLVTGALMAGACGGEEAAQEKQIDPYLQAKADAYVEACVGAIEYGAKVLQPECECIAASVVEYIEPERAKKFFDDITPYYFVKDAKRREDMTDRFFRDLIVGLTPEERPQWNAMFTEALPKCRPDENGDEAAQGSNTLKILDFLQS